MPNLCVSMKPEIGWNEEILRKKLLEQAHKERSIIESQSNALLVWDNSPVITGQVDNLQLRWRYKKFPKT